MKLPCLACTALLFNAVVFPLFPYAQTQKPPADNRPRTASIGGKILVDGKPAQNARVLVMEKNQQGGPFQMEVISMPGSTPKTTYSGVTGSDGNYLIQNLPAGNYQVEAFLRQYVPGNEVQGKSSLADLAESVALDEGEAARDVNFDLIRGGVITGRVTDADGRPIVMQTIQVDPIGEVGKTRSTTFVFGTSGMYQTDDRGVYRIYGLPPGQYVVSAGGEQNILNAGRKYPHTWHPSASESAQAKVIEVTSGSEATGVDITFGSARKGFDILGRVVDEETGDPVSGLQLIVMQTKGDNGQGIEFGGTTSSDVQGRFQFTGLNSGEHLLSVTDMEALTTGKGSNLYAEPLKVQITDGNLSNIEIRMKRGGSISGVATLDSGNDPGDRAKLSKYMILASVVPDEQAREHDLGMSFAPKFSMIQADGSFTIKGLRAGKLTLSVQGMMDTSLQVIRIERAGADLKNGLELNGRDHISGIRIVLAKAEGIVRGQVQLSGGELPKGWKLFITSSNRANPGAPSFAEVDGKGRFVLEGLMPGEHELILSVRAGNPQEQTNVPQPVTQIVQVGKGEVQVTMTLPLRRKDQEER